MAEKKTFLFFCGWAETLADFSPEDRCAVYDAAIAYAENGTLPTLPPVLQIAFKFIKKDIDEMQNKYEEICEKRREYGRRGGLAKATKSKQELANVANHEHKHKHKHEHEHEHEHEHKHDDNKDKSLLSAATTKENLSAHVHAHESDAAAKVEVEEVDLNVRIAKLKSDEQWREAISMKFKIRDEDVAKYLDEFRADMVARGRDVKKPQSLFVTWLGDKLYGSQRQGSPVKDPALGVGEYRNAKGQRTYELSGVVVPESAPPRPSAGHWWNTICKSWSNQI